MVGKNHLKKESGKIFTEIDIVKGFAALQVILIHVLSLHTNNNYSLFRFWDLIHFSVGMFVLSSGFLFALSLEKHPPNIKNLSTHIIRRFVRIVFPFYSFAVTFVFARYISNGFTIPHQLNIRNFINSLFIFNGITGGYEWIPRLFFALSGISLLVATLDTKSRKYITTLIMVISVIISAFLLSYRLSSLEQYENIFGWLVIYYFGFMLYKNLDNKKFLFLSVLTSGIVTILGFYILTSLGKNPEIFANKYPPNLYFVAYNILTTLFVVLLAKFTVAKKILTKNMLSIIKFLSKHSYNIFFYHLVVLELYKIRTTWVVDYILVTSITILLIIVVEKLKKLYITKTEQSTV